MKEKVYKTNSSILSENVDLVRWGYLRRSSGLCLQRADRVAVAWVQLIEHG
jgi:hypothetical protein